MPIYLIGVSSSFVGDSSFRSFSRHNQAITHQHITLFINITELHLSICKINFIRISITCRSELDGYIAHHVEHNHVNRILRRTNSLKQLMGCTNIFAIKSVFSSIFWVINQIASCSSKRRSPTNICIATFKACS